MSRDFWNAQLRARQVEEDTGISLADQANMPLDEWSRLAYGVTPAQAALAAINAQNEQPEPVEPVFTETVTGREPVGIDVNSDEFFLAWRQSRTSGGEGKGLFDSVSSQSAEYRAAAARHAGRTGYGREVHPEPLTGRYLRQGDAIDNRSARDRFYTPGNSFGGR